MLIGLLNRFRVLPANLPDAVWALKPAPLQKSWRVTQETFPSQFARVLRAPGLRDCGMRLAG